MELEIDPATLLAAKAGNLAAFEQILFIFERAVFSYVYRLVNHQQTAEDLTQETFIKIYKNIGNLNIEGNIKAWIFTIATHTVYDALRKRRSRPEPFMLDEAENSFETIDAEPAYYLVEPNTAALDVDSALKRIKPLYKSVLLLCYYQGLTYEEIAETLAMPLGTVKTCLHRAKLALKRELTK